MLFKILAITSLLTNSLAPGAAFIPKYESWKIPIIGKSTTQFAAKKELDYLKIQASEKSAEEIDRSKLIAKEEAFTKWIFNNLYEHKKNNIVAIGETVSSHLVDVSIERGDFYTKHSFYPRITYNHFLNMLNFAFDLHFNVVVGPDDFWNLIVHGVSSHLYTIGVEQDEQNKKMIRVKMPDVYNLRSQDYQALFATFHEQLSLDVKTKTPLKELLATGTFSSSHVEDSVMGHVSAMHGFEKYYKFDGFTRCGIPFVYLLGNESDWSDMIRKIEKLEEEPLLEGLSDWLTVVKNRIETIAKIANKNTNGEDFFKSMYKYNSESGVDYISGWIADFFPYRNNRNPDEPIKLADFSTGGIGKISLDKIVSSLINVPFTLTDEANSIVQNMRVYAGQIAFSYDAEKNALVPERSFLVVKESEEKMSDSDPHLPSKHPKEKTKEVDISDFLDNW